MQAVAADPKVMSILTKNCGEKGYRFHQGSRLRLLLTSLKQTMVNNWTVCYWVRGSICYYYYLKVFFVIYYY